MFRFAFCYVPRDPRPAKSINQLVQEATNRVRTSRVRSASVIQPNWFLHFVPIYANDLGPNIRNPQTSRYSLSRPGRQGVSLDFSGQHEFILVCFLSSTLALPCTSIVRNDLAKLSSHSGPYDFLFEHSSAIY